MPKVKAASATRAKITVSMSELLHALPRFTYKTDKYPPYPKASGKRINIKALYSNAAAISPENRATNILVIPQPGQYLFVRL